MSISKNPPKERHSALAAYRQVLRYIHSNSLQIGDKLDHHSVLVKKLHICNGTLDVAMKWLVQDGLLCRKQRQGTTILGLYPKSQTRMIWKVGIVLPGLDAASYFYPLLTHYLHCHLERHCASDRTYILSISAMPGAEVDGRRPEEFSGLSEDIDMGGMHGIITPTRLSTGKLPVCAAEATGHPTFGAQIDHKRFVIEASEELHRQRKKKQWVISADQDKVHTIFADAIAEVKARHFSANPKLFHFLSGVNSGRHICEQILALQPGRRPDGLIFQDDLTAQGFAARLAYQPDYRPGLAVQTNLQIPLAFPVPVTRFDIDVNLLASTAVDLLIEKLLKPETKERIVWLSSKLNRNPPDEIVANHLLHPALDSAAK